MMEAGLKSRIRRLEVAALDATAMPMLITGVTHFSSLDPIVAAIGMRDNVTVRRKPNEPLEDFTIRAGRELSERHMLAIYERDAALR
jgi:hypothetical protein